MRSLLVVAALAGTAGADVVDRLRPAAAQRANLRAAFERAERTWRRSCPVTPIDGLCVRRVQADPTGCAPASTILVGVTRHPALAERALAELARAAELYRENPEPELRDAYASAAIAAVDRDFEAMLAIPFPVLNYRTQFTSKHSTERVQSWFYRQRTYGARLRRSYDAIAMTASDARLAEHQRQLAAHHLAGAAPKELRGKRDKLAVYCSSMREIAAPLLESSLHQFAACVDRAVAHDRWTRICLRELEVMHPELFPGLRELVAAPSVRRVEIALEGEPEQ